MFCCLNTIPDAAADAPDRDAGDACAPATVCTGACIGGAHNVTTMVDGCVVSRCCVLDDAGSEFDVVPIDSGVE
jgi:hypothetical protein